MADTDTTTLPAGWDLTPVPAASKQQQPDSIDDLIKTPSSAALDQLRQTDLDLTSEKIGNEAHMARQADALDARYSQRMERMLGAEGATMDDVKPWNAAQEEAKYSHNLWEAFGSPGFVLGMIASSFTGNPMMSALSASAGAMNAMNQGDTAGYNRAFDSWRENTNLTLKRLDLEEQEFNQIADLRKDNMTAWHSQMEALLARFDDQRKLAVLRSGDDQQVIDLLDSQTKLKQNLSNAQQDIFRNHVGMQIYNSIRENSPDPNSPQTMVRAKMISELIMKGEARTPAELETVDFISNPENLKLPSEEFYKKLNDLVTGLLTRSAQAADDLRVKQELRDAETKKASDAGKDITNPEVKAEIDEAVNKRFAQSKHADSAATLSKVKDEAAIEAAIRDDPKFKDATPDQIALEKYRRLKNARSGVDLDDKTADLIADQYIAGDRQAATGFARNPSAMATIRKKIMEKSEAQGLSGTDLAMRIAEFHGIQAAETAVGRRQATIQMFGSEAKRVIEVAKKAEKEVPRGQFIPFNQAMLAFEKQTGDPKVVALGAALNAVINTYAKAINGGQQGTVSDKDHAREIVEIAYSSQQMDAVFNVLQQELDAALAAPSDVKAGLRTLAAEQPTPEKPKGDFNYKMENGKLVPVQ